MSADETKYESACATLILVAVVAALVTAQWWAPRLDAMLDPQPIVVMDCRR